MTNTATATDQPTVMLVYSYKTGAKTPLYSYYAFDERGEVIETVETDGRRKPNWSAGGICDHRGMGGDDGFKALHAALTAAEANAKAVGLDITRIPA